MYRLPTAIMCFFCRCTPVYTGIKCCDFSKTLDFTDNNVRDKIRTRDLLVRSQTLYPAELHVHFTGDFSTASMIIVSWDAFVNQIFKNIFASFSTPNCGRQGTVLCLPVPCLPFLLAAALTGCMAERQTWSFLIFCINQMRGLLFLWEGILAACVFYIFPKWLNSGGEFC